MVREGLQTHQEQIKQRSIRTVLHTTTHYYTDVMRRSARDRIGGAWCLAFGGYGALTLDFSLHNLPISKSLKYVFRHHSRDSSTMMML